MDPGLAFVAEESDVRTHRPTLQLRRQVGDPGRVHIVLFRSLVQGGDVHHEPTVPVRERGGVVRYAGHRPTEHSDLHRAHHRGGGLEPLEHRLDPGTVDLVDEHRVRGRDRVEPGLLGRVDLAIRHGPDHVGDGHSERTERRHCPLSGPRSTRVGHERHDDQLPVVLLRDERQRRRRQDVRDRRELLGRADRCIDE